MSDLKTRYMGLTLKAPLVASGARLCESAQNIARLEDQGIAAVVLPSLFEEQLGNETMRVNDDFHRGAESFYESLRFFPNLENYKRQETRGHPGDCEPELPNPRGMG
jgi:dihydroorotate dehydrogenase (fumarate)